MGQPYFMNTIKSKLMASLADVDQQEWALAPTLKSVVGRHVYFCIARQVWASAGGKEDPALKQILQHPIYTDRAVRLKLREMESEGLIALDTREMDRRSRSLIPTDKLLQIYESHAEQVHNSLSKNFYLVEKVDGLKSK
jgi:hypothetical protein